SSAIVSAPAADATAATTHTSKSSGADGSRSATSAATQNTAEPIMTPTLTIVASNRLSVRRSSVTRRPQRARNVRGLLPATDRRAEARLRAFGAARRRLRLAQAEERAGLVAQLDAEGQRLVANRDADRRWAQKRRRRQRRLPVAFLARRAHVDGAHTLRYQHAVGFASRGVLGDHARRGHALHAEL